jgi:hypothetical protein
VEAAAAIKPKVAIPIGFVNLTGGLDGILYAIKAFEVRAGKGRGFSTAEELFRDLGI